MDVEVDDGDLAYDQIISLPMDKFLGKIDQVARELVGSPGYLDEETGQISGDAWRRLVDAGLLSCVLMERDSSCRQEEIMKASRVLSYYDLALGLTYGIVAALGVVPLQRFSSDEEQLNEWLGIVRRGELIGLAITEWKKSGSAALDMDSNYEIHETKQGQRVVELDFSKHLQGLSGHGGLIVALLKKGAERKTVGLFFVPQEYIETEQTPMMGLNGIRYGINTGRITLDLERHLLAELPRERLDDFQDIFTKSRLLFVAMTLGHLERMEMETDKYANERIIEDRVQSEIPAVKGVIERIRAQRAISEAIFNYIVEFRTSSGASLLDGDSRQFVMEANIVKTLSTEYAIDSAAWRAELMGGRAYYEGSALQDYVDIWPFQIFEGSRLFLNNQIARSFLSPTRVDGKVKLSGFSNNEHENFMDYFFKVTEHREMFDGAIISENLSEWTKLMLANVRYNKIGNMDKGVIGEIVSRLFALGCVDATTQCGAVSLLNLEIAQLAQIFM